MSHEYLEKIQRINLKRNLDKEQKKIDKLYEKEGLTDRVLDRQVALNKQRHKENISDDNKVIYKRFVQ